MLLQDLYKTESKKILLKKFSYSSTMAIPRLKKITLNIGLSDSSDKKSLESAVSDMQLIAGQKPLITKVRKSIAGFKIRDGWPIGCKVTLRREKMWSFFNALVLVSIPRIRDFRGFSVKSFDGNGNYSLGISEQIIFPEIEYDKIDKIRGLDISITTSAKNNNEGEALLRSLSFPFKD
jgi:large subunit ribosomal protein L5